jgi:hypothetical protein
MNELATVAAVPVEILPRVPLPVMVGERELTPREVVFAQFYAESRSLVSAYKASHDVAPGAAYRSIWSSAAAVLARDHVNKRVAEIQDRLATAGIARAIDILRDLADIVTTDTNEIVRVQKYNCRHCNGTAYGMQWRDAGEFAQALDAYNAQVTLIAVGGKIPKGERMTLPTCSGGFGYDWQLPPNPTCPTCFGNGIERTIIADTTKLSPAALKCIKNIKQDKDGVITVELYDKQQARDMMLKMLGAYKNDGKGLPLTGAAPLDGISLAEQADPRLAADAYIRMLNPPTKG